ncbi:DNA-protecting protein DprA [Lysinibacillus agricola]|uniref:DNA-protecting protein DprA n=1 Tax=Lysinibacillus agricola TaxID=2590012 RepID=A0ABX7ANF9_9BACI|nr:MULTISPECIES: DNA-processing protein DprA [Lysinibacillus]KOS64646.1 hypothetical protein AN161_01075 [Lysinibacillus sp. FJAT-14222]QQP10443.1 DNA-protecting protein DprA [Lysinibacillus agricola]
MTNLKLILALKFTEKLGEKTLLKVLKNYPFLSEEDLISNKEIHKALKYKAVIERVTNKEYLKSKILEAENFIKMHRDKGIEIFSLHSPEYPKLLKLIDDPPPIIYCKGNIELLSQYKNIAVIGTREPTKYGVMAAKKLARHFANEGYTIVSGLAKGIDAYGHIGALEAQNGKTIAIMGGSLDKIYPSENKALAESILLKNGLLISEIALGEITNRGSFVRRDRIQSGMSLGVCPVQAPLESGTHHTINFAQLQKRIVFCPLPMENRKVEATQGIYKLIDDGVPVIRETEDYKKLFVLLENIALDLLGKEYLQQQNETLILQYEKELKNVLKKGLEVVNERYQLEELILTTLNKIKKEIE